MDLSIIIVNFNTLALTCNCIDSVIYHLNHDLQYEIILVDNAPKTDHSRMLSRYDKLVYLRSGTNIGFGSANNLGMDHAKGKHFLLLNSDTLIFDKSIQRCLAFMKQAGNDKVGLLGCKLLNEDGSYQASFYPFIRNNLINYCISNNPVLNRLFSIYKFFREPVEPRKVGDVSGAFMLLKREVYELSGGFDPDFFLYCEETEWCRNRISKLFDIIYYPEESIVHLGGKSAPGDLMFIQSQLSLALYWYKTGFFHYLVFIIYSYFNTAFFLLQYLFSHRKGRRSIRNSLAGFYHIQKYLFIDIPKYKPGYNSRSSPLVFKGAREMFFGNEA